MDGEVISLALTRHGVGCLSVHTAHIVSLSFILEGRSCPPSSSAEESGNVPLLCLRNVECLSLNRNCPDSSWITFVPVVVSL